MRTFQILVVFTMSQNCFSLWGRGLRAPDPLGHSPQMKISGIVAAYEINILYGQPIESKKFRFLATFLNVVC